MDNNDERPIIQALLRFLPDHMKIFKEAGCIPLDTDEWDEILNGYFYEPNAPAKDYTRVLKLAERHFGNHNNKNYKFEIVDDEKEFNSCVLEGTSAGMGPNKIWLYYFEGY